ncbi:MAG: hypothetical protein M0D55_06775 [Elusimicrobiota bacterium]|nr:MAG: hypothetical protein M0D55_06775 [Elusimicrobiota bacterium]
MAKPKPDYFPLIAGATLYYVHVDYSQSEPEVTRMILRVVSAAQDGDTLRAQVTKQWGAAAPQTQELRVDGKGAWAGKNLEIRFPPKLGDAWDAADDPYYKRMILSTKAKARTIVKDFTDCLEVGFTNEDTDSGSRFYAPGLGLVREEWAGESRNSVLSLADWRIPGQAQTLKRQLTAKPRGNDGTLDRDGHR